MTFSSGSDEADGSDHDHALSSHVLDTTQKNNLKLNNQQSIVPPKEGHILW